MFILDVKINFETIDSIEIQRVKNTKSGTNTYCIRKPEGFESIKIKHHYDEGYLPLLRKVIFILDTKGYETKPKYTWEQIQKMLKESNKKIKKRLVIKKRLGKVN